MFAQIYLKPVFFHFGVMTYTCTFKCVSKQCWGVALLHRYEIHSFCASISAWFLVSHLHPFVFSVKKKQKGKFLEEIFFVFKQPDEILHHGNLQSSIRRSRVNTTFPFTVRVVPVFKQFFANFRADIRTG